MAGQDAPPTHYSLKIQSFSMLSKASIERYSSDTFEAGGYKWKLSIYPNGNTKRGGQGHISIYLTIVDTSSLSAGWEVKAIFNFFIFNQVQDKYISFSGQNLRRFHAMKTEWGISNFMKLEVFNDLLNGYLVNDTCVFGVDIFVLKQIHKAECLSMIEEPVNGNYSWKIKPLSAFILERYDSNAFTVGEYKWKIILYPRGNGEGKGNSISVFLCLDESSLPPDTKLFVKYTLRVIDQNSRRAEHFEFKSDNHFGQLQLGWGVQKFMSHAKFNDPKKSFLVEDTCTIEADVTLLGIVTTA